MERINVSRDLINFPFFDSRHIVENIDFIVHGIKNVKERKFVKVILIQKNDDSDNIGDYIGDVPVQNYCSMLAISIKDRKDSFNKKKKKKR